MAMTRSLLARVVRGGHPVSQPLLRAEGNLSADTPGKRCLSVFKGRRYYSIWDKLPNPEFLEPVGPVLMLFAFTYGIGTMVPYGISSMKRTKQGAKELEEWKAEDKERLVEWKAYEANREKGH